LQEWLLLTAGTDRLVKLWDTRSVKAPVHTFAGHNDDVLNVAWSPFNEGIFGSASADRRLLIWDLAQV
jgi:histone-binding protein RBBP4